MSDPSEATEFFGGWVLTASDPLRDLGQWQLRLSGTDDWDGDVQLVNDVPFELHVSGARWSLTVLTHFPPGGYFPTSPVSVVKRTEPPGRLVVDVVGASGSDIYPSKDLRLRCTYDDPHPPPTVPGPPWDFTLPGEVDVVEIP